MTLPINLIPNTQPPRFRWKQVVSTPSGNRTVDHEGTLPPTVEGAVVELIKLAHHQAREIVAMGRTIQDKTDQITAQDKLLGKPCDAGDAAGLAAPLKNKVSSKK